MKTLRLAAGAWDAALLPALGGSIAWLRVAGENVLRPSPADANDPLETACFPLVPYANRIADGGFAFEGRTVTLPRNFGDHPHPLHGVGWQRAWDVVEAAEDAATLRLVHPGDADWPWAFVAEQRFRLFDEGLSIVLSVTAGAEAMPAGLGFHPYFPATAGTRLRTAVEGAWLSDTAQLPTQRVGGDRFGDWASGDTVSRGTLVDHAHDGWSGNASIDVPGRTICLDAEGTRWLHLYMPPGEAFFCAEPVSHLPDAVNRAGQGMRRLGPGQAMSVTMRITAHDSD